MTETIHIVQPFARPARQGFMPKLPQQFATAEEAAQRAEVIASSYAGVIAYSMDVDEDAGEYSDPRVLARYGELPEFE